MYISPSSRNVLTSACLCVALAITPRSSVGLRVGATFLGLRSPRIVPLRSHGGANAPRPVPAARRGDFVRMAAESSAGKLGDLGRKLTWNLVGKNTKWIVSLSAAAVLLYRRDALAVSAIAGALGNAILGKVFKRILRQKRPDGAPLADPGMPSVSALIVVSVCCLLRTTSDTALISTVARHVAVFPLMLPVCCACLVDHVVIALAACGSDGLTAGVCNNIGCLARHLRLAHASTGILPTCRWHAPHRFNGIHYV